MSQALVLTLLGVILAVASGHGYGGKQSYDRGGGYGYGGGQGSGGDLKDGCRRSVERFLKAYSDVYATKNAPGVAAFYSKDAVLPTNQFDVISGRDAVRDFYQVAFDQGSNSAVVNHTTVEPDSHCKFVMVVGTFVLSSTNDPQATRSGTLWQILKNENRVWQIDMQRLVFN